MASMISDYFGELIGDSDDIHMVNIHRKIREGNIVGLYNMEEYTVHNWTDRKYECFFDSLVNCIIRSQLLDGYIFYRWYFYIWMENGTRMNLLDLLDLFKEKKRGTERGVTSKYWSNIPRACIRVTYIFI